MSSGWRQRKNKWLTCGDGRVYIGLDQFKSVLDRFNVKPITAVGEAFDPHYHEALTHMPSAEFAEGVCMNEVRKGYLMGEKLLRAAQVVVSSGAAEEGSE